MKKRSSLAAALLLTAGLAGLYAAEPEWNPAGVKDCDRACLTSAMDRYLDAMIKHTPSSFSMVEETRFTENTAGIPVGEGILWSARVEPTAFRIYVVDPPAGQVALQTVLNIERRPALVAIRLKVERGRVLEIEHLLDRAVAKEALVTLQTPRAGLVSDVPASERSSRELMIRAANSYFDALEGDNGKIGAFADDCVRHENGYQTSTHKTPGRAAPGPVIPTADTAQGRAFLKLSTMGCAEQISTKAFSFISKIRPRRVLIVDQQKGVVSAFPLFIMNGKRRFDGMVGFPELPAQAGLGMLQNMVTMETFGVRGGKIHEIEVFPFVNIPYGLGNGWTPGAGR
jgi:hypothetical protein